MTSQELDSAMRYFSALFARWPQAGSPEVMVVYGQRVGWAQHFDVCQAFDELAEGCLQFPSVAEVVEAVRETTKRNAPQQAPVLQLTAPKETPLEAYVRGMLASGPNRKVGPFEIRGYRIVRRSSGSARHFKIGALEDITKAELEESYSSVDEFLEHEGHAVA